MMWVDVPQISLLSFFFSVGSVAPVQKKNSARYRAKWASFQVGSALDVTHSAQPLRYKWARYRYGAG